MKTELYSISKIFTERLLRIPDYQRGYAWTEKHLKDYWNDLTQLEKDKNHYIGVLTLEDAPQSSVRMWTDDAWIIDSKSFSPFHVVDGQQRLTTTIILIQSICEAAGEGAILNYDSISDIKKKYIFDSKDGGLSRSYLFGYEADNPSYNFLKVNIFNEGPDIQLPLEETIYTQNLINAKKFFLKKFENLKTEEIEILFKKVTQHFLFAVYSMSDDIDVYITFETMNNRGKPLSHLELLKNRLIYLSTKFSIDEFEKSEIRRTINNCWRAIYHQLGRNKERQLEDDLFLFNHFVLYFGKNLGQDTEHSFLKLRRGYLNTFKDILLEEKFTTKCITEGNLKPADVIKYVTNLKTSVEVWYNLLNPKNSDFQPEVKQWLEKLNRIGIEPHLPLIMTFFKECRSTKLRVDLLKSVERFSFILLLLRYQTSNVFDMSELSNVDLAFGLSAKEETPENIIKSISTKMDNVVENFLLKNIKSNFKAEGFYGWSGIRYFMYEYELHLQSTSKNFSEKLDWRDFNRDDRDHKSIEHIYPQRARSACWLDEFDSYSTPERTALRNSLGNLVPLSIPKNSSLSNKCFHDKKSNKDNTVGYCYGCLSENEVAQSDSWGSKQILERGLKLLDFMEARWNLKLGDKYDFLSLSFMKNKSGKKTK